MCISTSKACTITKVVDGTGEAQKGVCEVSSMNLSAGSAAATATITDGDGGTTKWYLSAVTNGNDPVSFPRPMRFTNGVYVTLTGTGAKLSIAIN